MLFLLIRKEMLEQLLSLRFAISCIVCFVVILSSVFVLTKDYKEDMLDHRTNLVMHRNQVLDYEYPWALGDQGILVDKPLNVMKVFLKGISQENTTTVRVFSWGEPQFQSAAQSNPVVHLFPTIDLVFFVSIIMSLLALAFSYDAVSGEKEQGTLRLMMSYSVPRDTVLLSKWIGGYATLITPFLLSFLCGLIVTLMFPEAHLAGDNWIQLAGILVLAFLYVSAVYSLGLLVSTRTYMASTSITVLLLIWVLIALVIPNLSPYFASQIVPVRSMQSVEKEKRTIEQQETAKVVKEFEEWREKKEEEGGIDWNSKEVTEYIRGLRERILVSIAKKQAKLVAEFKRSMDNQVSLASNLSRLSPLSSFVYAATEISGTGSKERDHFMESIDRHHRDWQKYVEDKIVEFQEQQRKRQQGEDPEPFDPSDYPRFIHKTIALKDQFQGTLRDVLVLAAWNIIFFMAAYLSFLRYDVR